MQVISDFRSVQTILTTLVSACLATASYLKRETATFTALTRSSCLKRQYLNLELRWHHSVHTLYTCSFVGDARWNSLFAHVCAVDGVDPKIAMDHLLPSQTWVLVETVASWYQVPKDSKDPVVLGKKDLYPAYQAETAMWPAKVHPDILGADSSDLQSIVTEARCGVMLKYSMLQMNCFLWPYACFPGLHHAERSRKKRRIRRDLSIV